MSRDEKTENYRRIESSRCFLELKEKGEWVFRTKKEQAAERVEFSRRRTSDPKIDCKEKRRSTADLGRRVFRNFLLR